MTRGTLVILHGNAIYESAEFNGDQYPTGYGLISYRLMQNVNDMETFRKGIIGLNWFWRQMTPSM